MARPGGYGQVGGEFGCEVDTITCAHCQRVVFLNADRDLIRGVISAKPAYRDIGGFCRACMKSICGPCCDKGGCDPAEKKLERIEAKANSRRWLCEAMGMFSGDS